MRRIAPLSITRRAGAALRTSSTLFPGSVRTLQLTVPLLGGSIAFQERTMESKSVFISSCSRRQFARRRPTRKVLWFHTHLWTIVLVVAVASFVAIRAGF